MFFRPIPIQVFNKEREMLRSYMNIFRTFFYIKKMFSVPKLLIDVVNLSN